MTLHEGLENVEEALNENKLDEGLWQGTQKLMNGAKQFAKDVGENGLFAATTNALNNGIQKVGNNIKNGVNNGLQKVGNFVDNKAAAEKAKEDAKNAKKNTQQNVSNPNPAAANNVKEPEKAEGQVQNNTQKTSDTSSQSQSSGSGTQQKINAVKDLQSMATACKAVLNDATQNQSINWKDI